MRVFSWRLTNVCWYLGVMSGDWISAVGCCCLWLHSNQFCWSPYFCSPLPGLDSFPSEVLSKSFIGFLSWCLFFLGCFVATGMFSRLSGSRKWKKTMCLESLCCPQASVSPVAPVGVSSYPSVDAGPLIPSAILLHFCRFKELNLESMLLLCQACVSALGTEDWSSLLPVVRSHSGNEHFLTFAVFVLFCL